MCRRYYETNAQDTNVHNDYETNVQERPRDQSTGDTMRPMHWTPMYIVIMRLMYRKDQETNVYQDRLLDQCTGEIMNIPNASE